MSTDSDMLLISYTSEIKYRKCVIKDIFTKLF